MQPSVSAPRAAQWLQCSFPTALKLLTDFESRGWLREVTGYGRNRQWRYQPYLDLFHREAVDASLAEAAAPQVTGSAFQAPPNP